MFLAEIGGGVSLQGSHFGVSFLVRKHIYPNGMVDSLSLTGWGASLSGNLLW